MVLNTGNDTEIGALRPHPKMQTIKLYVPDMCCGAETALIEKAFKGSDLITDMRFDTLARTVVFTPKNESVTAAMLMTIIDSVGMKSSEIRESVRSAMTLEIENMKSEADVKRILDIIGLDCGLDKTARRVTFHTDAAHGFAILEKLQLAGFSAAVVSSEKAAAPGPSAESIPWLRLGTALVFAAAAEAIEVTQALPEWAVMVCAAAAILLAGFQTIFKGLGFLLRLIFNMDTLMSVAVIGAVCLGAWPEAAMVMVLYEIGEAIEDLSMVRARNAIRKLMDVAPAEATVKVGEVWQRMKADAVPAGALFRIEPGERAALDGMVEEGAGAMDESMITGESMPAAKEMGSRVFAGALALESTLVVRATAAACDSMSARIIRAVEEAEQKKAPLQRFVDKFASRYTPTVFALAILTALLGPVITGDAWTVWIYRALVLLVISCPCALVISTPVTIVSAVSTAARAGILIKGGVYLEAGRTLKNVCLDKTGTVTQGKPALSSITLTSFIDEKRALQLAASLASMSSHPVSRAIAEHFVKTGASTLAVHDFKAIPGCGTQGVIDGALFFLTNLNWLLKKGPVPENVRAAFEAAQQKGETAVALSDMFGVAAVFAVSDTLKANAAESIALMKKVGLTPWLLTGDNKRAAQTIASAAGIENVRAELLPEQKLEVIEALDTKAPTAMVGDGINDAPALSRARIGFAMGIKGTDTAIEAADVAIMDDNIAKIAWFKKLSELTHRTIIENIVFALGVKLCFMVAALAGYATMWMAVFADTGVCLIVVAWGLRLMRASGKVDRMLAG